MRGCCLFLALVLTTRRLTRRGGRTWSLFWRMISAGENWAAMATASTRHRTWIGWHETECGSPRPTPRPRSVSPYRAALLTGQYPARIGILDYLRPNSANALSTRHVTLPEILGRRGYATGMIGKWHLTGYSVSRGRARDQASRARLRLGLCP